VTNKPLAFAVPLLEEGPARFLRGLWRRLLPEEEARPHALLKVCEDFALAPAQVVAIGDSSNDAKPPAAGCRVLNVPYGYNHGESIHDVDSDGIVSTLRSSAAISVD
jgi:phosphoglycolate phosphatase